MEKNNRKQPVPRSARGSSEVLRIRRKRQKISRMEASAGTAQKGGKQ